MFEWGESSRQRMQGVDNLLITLATEALHRSKYDMTIPWMGGYRSEQDQQQLYAQGTTKCDGIENKSYHQSGYALDIAPVISFDKKSSEHDINRAYNQFAQCMFDVYKHTDCQNLVLHWGGLFGATGWDKAHWELKENPYQKEA